MFSVKLIMQIVLLGISLGLAGCDGVTDDLLPSGDDKRPDVVEGSPGTRVGQLAPDFSLFDTLGNSHGLYDELDQLDVSGVVLYFTMWCTACNAEANHMRINVMPNFPNVSFFLVDFVSGSITDSRAAQELNALTGIETLVDKNQQVSNSFNASMGTTVVVDSAGKIVRMNELYKDSVKLTETLRAL